MTRPLEHFSEIAGNYDSVFCDLWGVVHDGVRPYARAVEALAAFRRQGGQVALVSNSPMPAATLRDYLDQIGVPRTAYDALISSGETTRALLRERAGQAMFFIGPVADHIIHEGIELREAGAPEEADFVLCTALFPHLPEDPQAYRKIFAPLVARGLPLICANPDHVVEHDGRLRYEAGALAHLYEEMGGQAIYTGKPHPPIYHLAMQELERVSGRDPEPGRSLAIGDSLRTDIRGAQAQGMDGLLISAGVHAAEVGGRELADVLEDHALAPVAVMKELVW